jgi:GT2 family glycosyltransferase
MTQNNTSFSVVMLTYDITPDLANYSMRAVESLKKTNGEFEFVIVDNGSPYGAGVVRPNADIYIRNKENVGYPGAVNQGMKLSHGEFVALSNNDIRVSSNWMEIAEEVFKDPKVGTLHYKMIGYDEPMEQGKDTWIGGKERWCSSSFFVVRREAFQGYDEAYGAGGYDDYSHHHRMRSKGWEQAYTNKAVYQHADSLTYRSMDDGKNRSERDIKNREYFKQKHGEYPDVLFAKEFPEQVVIPWRPFP